MADLHQPLRGFNPRPPATSGAIAEFENASGRGLPRDYSKFLGTADGGEGFIGEAYVILWGVGELLRFNHAYQVEEYVPGLLIFGSDGGGQAFGFDTRDPGWPIVQVPFVGMDWSLAESMDESFTGFLQRLLTRK